MTQPPFQKSHQPAEDHNQHQIDAGNAQQRIHLLIGAAVNCLRSLKQFLSADSRDSMLRQNPNLTCKDIFDAAASDDQVAKDILEQVYALLAEFCANLSNTLDPEVIVLGGGVSKAGQTLIDGISRHFGKYVFHAMSDMKFALATLGNDAGAVGAFKLALDSFG